LVKTYRYKIVIISLISRTLFDKIDVILSTELIVLPSIYNLKKSTKCDEVRLSDKLIDLKHLKKKSK